MSRHRGIRATTLVLTLLFTTACGSTYAQGRRNSPNHPHYPSSPGRGGVSRGYQDPAYARGVEDGYRRGLEAAHDGDRYDVRRENLYRNAEHGYDRRYGSRNEWRQVYRDGFTRGYDQGYREARSRDNGRYRRR